MVVVRRCGRHFEIAVPWRDEVYLEPTVVGAICTLSVDLVEAYVRSAPGRICLHGAAVEIGGRLLVFPAASRAGKSTLAARLAAEGLRLFTDDLLALEPDTGRGMAFGVMPRLRLPLPDALDERFRSFLDRHAGARDPHYCYLNLPEALLAPFGTAAPLGAVVLLERDEALPVAKLERAGPARALRLLVGQSLSSEGLTAELLDGLYRLVEPRPCLVLRYPDVEQAVALLRERFSKWPDLAHSVEPKIALRRADPAHSAENGAEARYQQAPEVYGRAVEDRVFLTKRGGTAACELDMIGAGVWNILADPTSADEASQLLSEVFPDADRSRITADVDRLFAQLKQQGLIRPC